MGETYSYILMSLLIIIKNMKKYWKYPVILSVLFFSCSKNKSIQDGVEHNTLSYGYDLVKKDKILAYELDDNTKYQFTALFLYKDRLGNEYLTFKNSKEEIYFYDLNNEKFLFKTKIEREGPNSILGPSGYHIEDLNNIYITSVALPTIFKIDTTGTIVQKIQYETTSQGYHVTPTFKSASFFYTPLVIIDSKLFITQSPWARSPVSTTPLCVVIDTVNHTQSAYPFFFPPLIEDSELFNSSLTAFIFSREFNGKEFVYSFYYDEDIYVASIDHKQVKKYKIISKYINKVQIGKRASDMLEGAKNDYGDPCYGNLIYDPYRDVYYRLAYPKVELESGLNYVALTSQGRKKFSIIILDKNFNVIGETLFPEFIYNPSLMFVHKNGLYICNNHSMNPNFNEDVLSFQCFELKKQ